MPSITLDSSECFVSFYARGGTMLMIITKKDKEIDSSVGMTIVYPYV